MSDSNPDGPTTPKQNINNQDQEPHQALPLSNMTPRSYDWTLRAILPAQSGPNTNYPNERFLSY
ncbi:hypothetical protein BKA57DRAFT_500533 [Linnemannia elongata]|nr:hypothetical protein BKA57DRAFT_500533 [Linnemannia elongata]